METGQWKCCTEDQVSLTIVPGARVPDLQWLFLLSLHLWHRIERKQWGNVKAVDGEAQEEYQLYVIKITEDHHLYKGWNLY